jgi:hypothetical protein
MTGVVRILLSKSGVVGGFRVTRGFDIGFSQTSVVGQRFKISGGVVGRVLRMIDDKQCIVMPGTLVYLVKNVMYP